MGDTVKSSTIYAHKIVITGSRCRVPCKLKSTVSNKKPRVPFYTLVQGNVDTHFYLRTLYLFLLVVSLPRTLGWSLLPKEVASVKPILIYQPCHQPQKHKIGKLYYAGEKKKKKSKSLDYLKIFRKKPK